MERLINKFTAGLQRTKTRLVRSFQSVFRDDGTWGEDSYEQLEEALISADLGISITQHIINDIRDRYERGQIQTSTDIVAATKSLLSVYLNDGAPHTFDYNIAGPTVILLVGVNGSGKTTTAGKLACMWQREGKSVVLAACDTFRAAAVEQLKIWGERSGCQVVSAKHGADPASVAFDATQAAVARKADILLVDTAGRQHTKKGLMDELGKIAKTIGKAFPGAPHEIWLVVDGSTGTNALQQARTFGRSVELSGLCLTKLDGSSKGGIVVAIYNELKLPIHFVGLGEEVFDLQAFDPQSFADALFTD